MNKSNKRRLEIAKRYHSEIDILGKMPFNPECSYHLYWILMNNRKKFLDYMSSCGIEVGTHYQPVHLMTYYKSKTTLKITEKAGNEIVTLPMHPLLTESQVDYVIKSINKFVMH